MTPILTDTDIRRRLTRLAWQLWEANFGAKALHLVGIAGGGDRLAELLAAELAVVAPAVRLTRTRLTLDKKAPLASPIHFVPAATSFAAETIVLIDDVLNSGRTLAFALAEVVRGNPARVQTLLLVDRQHPAFPVAATFTGLTLATTPADHVRVELPDDGEFGAWLV
ncbi:MAG: phosphoribosyltransferase [Hymenobacteraceae bacterium]|nr:phosphoribosyltransferase [Hymenobacteraceae bacterium]